MSALKTNRSRCLRDDDRLRYPRPALLFTPRKRQKRRKSCDR
jgi:hypothetical protein